MVLEALKILGTVLIMAGIALSVTVGISINNTLCVILGSFFLVLGIIYNKLSEVLKKIVIAGIVLGSFLFFILLGFIGYGCVDTTDYKENVVVVLGSGIKGVELTPMLKSRLDRVVDYYNVNPDVTIIVSGGQGRGEDIPEAEAMSGYLYRVMSHLPQKPIIVMEDKSKNTVENLKNVKNILSREEREYKIVLITSNFHMYRAKETAEILGMNVNTFTAPMPWYLLPGAVLREIISIIKFKLQLLV